MFTVDKYDAPLVQCVVDKSTGGGKVYKKICVFDVFDRDPELLNPRSGRVSRNRVCAHRNDMRYATFAEGSRRPGCYQALLDEKKNNRRRY